MPKTPDSSIMQSLGASLFYLFLSLLGLIISKIFHVSPWTTTPLIPKIPSYLVILSGLVLGLFIVILSHILDRFKPFARLNTIIAHHLPGLRFSDIVILSIFSSFGEELLFRGVLLQLLGIHISSLIFGLLHYGGKRDFLLWGIMGWVMGYFLGGLFLATGSLLAPMLAHLTINFFNLNHLIGTHASGNDDRID